MNLERGLLVDALRKKLLGPALAREKIPYPDYILGSLVPAGAEGVSEDEEIDLSDIDEIITVETNGRRSDSDEPPVHSSRFEGQIPSSIGISFNILSSDPSFAACVSWGTYSRIEDSDNFERTPHCETISADSVSDWENGRRSWHFDDVEVLARASSREEGVWRMSVFLVNRKQSVEARLQYRIFQPQIRINLGKGSELLPIDNFSRAIPADREEGVLTTLYRNRRGFARGHLVSAVWSDVDPARPAPNTRSRNESPWHDGVEILEEQELSSFSVPDLRTEFIPAYSILSPNLDEWPGFSKESPELGAEKLSEAWSPADLSAMLMPLVEGYSEWENTVRSSLDDSMVDWQRKTIIENLDICKEAANRIRSGIEFLKEDEDARHAFLFANRAIWQANSWSGWNFSWRPFQLAFILMNLRGVSDRNHPDRELCDLLWFPTGGGKTEAYLGLAAFVMAFRRRFYGTDPDTGLELGAGVSVISRYTLRLLTIQQFRRASAMVTSCERLRCLKTEEGIGWRHPASQILGDHPWGRTRFSIGLWVGAALTPNQLQSKEIPRKGMPPKIVQNAIRGGGVSGVLESSRSRLSKDKGSPDQILNCPCCNEVLSLGPEDISLGANITLHITTELEPDRQAIFDYFEENKNYEIETLPQTTPIGVHHITFLSITTNNSTPPDDLDLAIREAFGGDWFTFTCFRPTKPGYLPVGSRRDPTDFSIVCPNPSCELNKEVKWSEKIINHSRDLSVVDGKSSTRCPIPAFTVDEQIYRECPSMVIATVDKFAQLSKNQHAGTMFGDVLGYSSNYGFYRDASAIRRWPDQASLDEFTSTAVDLQMTRFTPPDFILQDELHLIEGPLGTIVGLYEMVIKELCTTPQDLGPKYIASTATARSSESQILSLFGRDCRVFPPAGAEIDDSFWSRHRDIGKNTLPTTSLESHPSEEDPSGRLYIGLCSPGRSMKTLTVRVWSEAIRHVRQRQQDGAEPEELDKLWTLVGYFNAVKELAGAKGLVEQDIPERMDGANIDLTELSSRVKSTELPGILEALENNFGKEVVLTTSMFGTGVDVSRLGLMSMAGQPKTASSYIQATGRVGRSRGGLVLDLFRAGRPRDLDHFEFFSTYHRSLYRHVEPVSVQPFSPRAVDRVLGPAIVALLRQASHIGDTKISPIWRQNDAGPFHWMDTNSSDLDDLISSISQLIMTHNSSQPAERRMDDSTLRNRIEAAITTWRTIANKLSSKGEELAYHEVTIGSVAENNVVLGSEGHSLRDLDQVYENSPNSMRDIESMLNFQGRSDSIRYRRRRR